MEATERFDLTETYSGQRWVEALADYYIIVEEQAKTETLTFFDTFDWRLFNESLLLYQSGYDLILQDLSNDNPLYRQSINAPVTFAWDLPEGKLKKQLEPLIEMRALLELTQAHLHSAVFRILNDDEKTVVRLLYQSLEPHNQADATAAPTEQVSLKPVRGYRKHAKNIRHHLEMLGLRPNADSLLAKALALGNRPPGDYSSQFVPQLQADMPAAEATKIILRVLLQTMRKNEAGIVEDIDSEFLHDFRVAVRRTRSVLSQVKAVFPAQVTERFKQDFAWIGKLTNDLRDLDVYLLAKDGYKMMLPDTLRDDISPLFEYLRQKRSLALKKVTDGLASKKYTITLQAWERFLREPIALSPTAPNSHVPIIELARRQIYKKYRRIIKQGSQILENTEDERLHDLRIECKKLRYLLEFFSSLFSPKKMKRLVKQLKRLQVNLGDFNDLCVQEAYLVNIAQEMPLSDEQSKKVFLAIGSLIDTLDQQRVRVRADFARTFAKFARPTNKKHFKELFQ